MKNTVVSTLVALICAVILATVSLLTASDMPEQPVFTAQSRIRGPFTSTLPILVFTPLDPPVETATRARLSVYDWSDTSTPLQGTPRLTLDVSFRLNPEEHEHQIEPVPLPPNEKKNLVFSLNTDARGAGSLVSLAGLPHDREWVLLGCPQDRAMLRNGIAYRLGEIICPLETPRTRFCEVFMDSGGELDYRGIHILGESQNEHFRRMTEGSPPTLLLKYCPESRNRTGNFLNVGNKVFTISVSTMDPVAEHEASQTAGLSLWNISTTLYSSEPSVFAGFPHLIDVPAICNMYLLNLLMDNANGREIPYQLFRGANGMAHAVPEWVFDAALAGDELWNGNEPTPPPPARRGKGRDDITARGVYSVYEALDGKWFLWFDRFFLSETFARTLIDRYFLLRRTTLARSNVDAIVTDILNELGPALDRDWDRWRDVYAITSPGFTDTPQEDVDRIRRRLRERDTILVTQLERLSTMTTDFIDNTAFPLRWALYVAFTAGVAAFFLWLIKK